jgi:hypothetical protein
VINHGVTKRQAISASQKRGKMKSVTPDSIGLILIGELLLGHRRVLIDVVAPERMCAAHLFTAQSK